MERKEIKCEVESVRKIHVVRTDFKLPCLSFSLPLPLYFYLCGFSLNLDVMLSVWLYLSINLFVYLCVCKINILYCDWIVLNTFINKNYKFSYSSITQ